MIGDATTQQVDALLSRLDAGDRDRPVPLLGGEAAKLAEQIVGRRPHRSWFHRQATTGTRGIRLAVLALGRERYVTARSIAQHLVACGAAAAEPQPRRRGRRVAGARR